MQYIIIETQHSYYTESAGQVTNKMM